MFQKIKEFKWEKKYWLWVIIALCLILLYLGSKNIPYTDYLPAIGGGAYALSFITDLAK